MFRNVLRSSPTVILTALLGFNLAAASNLSADETDAGWKPLFNGKDLDGWIQRGGKAKYRVEDKQIVGSSVPHTSNSFLCTKRDYADFILELEFKVHPKLNSGVQVRSQCFEEKKTLEINGKKIAIPAGRVHGYQVEIDPSARAWSGGIYDEGRRGWLKDLKGNAAARKAFKRNEWNKFRIECRGDSIKTWLNGVAAADLKDSLTPSGFIALQVHGVGAEQKPREVRFRNLRIKELTSVPKGEIAKYRFDKSKLFPGTVRDYWVYVPKQYDPSKPACVYVGQDGIGFKAPAAFDRLIHNKEIPVVIGVFVMHGRVPARSDKALDRFNRSYEYDGLGDNYARFLLEELLPEVEKKTTADGRAIRLSHNGNDRCIGGASSGAICAFTAAWERPDAFRRVFSAVGTYVGLRGGNNYPTWIRKFEPKPIRVFLEDGSNDLNIYGGDWWMANQEMERALRFAGYEVNHAWGKGGHNAKHGTEVFPDAMRWLWKDWPAPVKAGAGSPQLQAILLPGEDWKLVSKGHKFTEGPAVNAKGEVFFNDIPNGKTYKIGLDGAVKVFLADSKKANGQAFGPDGRLYAVTATRQVLAYDANGKAEVIADGIRGNDLVVGHKGDVYVTQPGVGREPSLVWHISPKGEKKVVDRGLRFANGIALSPDQSLLYVADYASHWVYSYQVRPDGSLAHKQRYYHLHVPDTADDSGADGMRVDRDGRLYVATRMGIQVCDQAGRVHCIIPTPNGRVANLCFGGPDFDTLFATCGDRVYKREVKVRGCQSFQGPRKPARPRL